MIRIVGTVAASGGGSQVDYKIEFIPVALMAIGVSVLASIPILVAWSLLGYRLALIAPILILIIVLSGILNLWMSERQAGWLRDFVTSTLDGQNVR